MLLRRHREKQKAVKKASEKKEVKKTTPKKEQTEKK